MRKVFALALMVAISSQAVGAREIRRDAMPEAFWGTWVPAANVCKDGDPSAITLSANAYAGPAGSCVIAYVTEIPGPVYSARMMHCSGPNAKPAADLVLRPGDSGQIVVGPSFDRLVAHQRCATGAPPAKQQ